MIPLKQFSLAKQNDGLNDLDKLEHRKIAANAFVFRLIKKICTHSFRILRTLKWFADCYTVTFAKI